MLQLNDQDIMTDCLESTKHSSETFHRAVLESANDNIRNTFMRMHNDTLMMSKTLFDIMQQRGWYQVEPATGAGVQMQAQMQQPQMQQSYMQQPQTQQSQMQQQAPYHAVYRPETQQQYQAPNPNQGGF